MASANTRFRLASSILRFLQDELKFVDITPDKAESLEVAVQCLRLAYEIPEDEDLSEEMSIFDIYMKNTPQEDTSPLSEEDKKRAEDLKQQGNELMKNDEFDEAIKKYNSAIAIDSQSAVYYCNRAAAYTGLGQHDSALSDCRKAVRIDQNYSKAYSRMGLIYSKLEKYEMAVDCYDKALKLDPQNEGYRNNMKIAQDKIKESAAAVGPMGFPAFGGSGGMADILGNPAFMNMAQQVMANPAMQQMAVTMMGSFMGGGPPPGEADVARNPEAVAQPPQQLPDVAEVLRMGQQFAAQVTQDNPDLIASLRSQMHDEGGDQKDDSPPS